MNKFLLLAVLLVTFPGFCVAQVDTTPPPIPSVKPEKQLTKTIVFISMDARIDHNPVTLSGTGFLYAIPESRVASDASYMYLVTNRHVASGMYQDENGNCKNAEVLKTYATMNLKKPVGNTRSEKMALNFDSKVHWYYPADQAIDLAVLPVHLPDWFDALEMTPNYILTQQFLDEKQVGPGDKVLTTGYFSAYAGLHEIQPIIREGVLAMMPDGPMTTTTCKPGNVYLADVHIIPDNSGSPIFIVPSIGLGSGVTIGGVPSVFGLLGIVSGYMYETSDFALRASTTWKGSLNANSGIAVRSQLPASHRP